MFQPSKIVCAGINYHQHAQEMKLPLPQEPVIFLKPPSSLIYDGDSIIYPAGVRELDYEGELAVVIAKSARNIAQKDINKYIAGYTIANDVTARDLQRQDGQWTRAKSFDTFCPILPKIVKNIDPDKLQLKTFLNGDLKQEANTADMIFSVAEIVSFISSVMTLLPGDIILTGTPAGIGHMQKGDLVVVEIESIGKLQNKVI